MPVPDPARTLYIPDRAGWRAWLEGHYRTEPEVWLVYYRKATGRPRVAYNDAVEEALCFGWIDSVARSLDGERFAQRFSPRRAGSSFSQPNRERLRRLAEAGLIAPDVMPSAEAVLREPFVAAPDILSALQADPIGWAHFQEWSGSYQRIRIAFVDSARGEPETFEKRLRHLLRMNAAGRQFGHDLQAYY
jgi:uncharacterized protein YdeI (YjbR/CyaY-like superfamily)